MQYLNGKKKRKKKMKVSESNYGEVVACDGCNGPYGTNTKGGVLLGSSALCGECCDKYGYDKPDYKYADEVDEIWNKENFFRDNVLEYRERAYGTKDLVCRITTF